jgi:hypothetical protein
VTLTVIVKISGPKHSTVPLTGRAVMTEADPTPGDNVQVIGVSLRSPAVPARSTRAPDFAGALVRRLGRARDFFGLAHRSVRS